MKLLSSLAPVAQCHGSGKLTIVKHDTLGRSEVRPIRGRGLGGSSAINFMVWQEPPAVDIDAWERLGANGWNWDRYHAAVKKAEK